MCFHQERAESGSSWQVDHTISPERSIFGKTRESKSKKSLFITLQCVIFDFEINYVAASMVTGTHTHTTVTLRRMRRGLITHIYMEYERTVHYRQDLHFTDHVGLAQARPNHSTRGIRLFTVHVMVHVLEIYKVWHLLEMC